MNEIEKALKDADEIIFGEGRVIWQEGIDLKVLAKAYRNQAKKLEIYKNALKQLMTNSGLSEHQFLIINTALAAMEESNEKN